MRSPEGRHAAEQSEDSPAATQAYPFEEAAWAAAFGGGADDDEELPATQVYGGCDFFQEAERTHEKSIMGIRASVTSETARKVERAGTLEESMEALLGEEWPQAGVPASPALRGGRGGAPGGGLMPPPRQTAQGQQTADTAGQCGQREEAETQPYGVASTPRQGLPGRHAPGIFLKQSARQSVTPRYNSGDSPPADLPGTRHIPRSPWAPETAASCLGRGAEASAPRGTPRHREPAAGRVPSPGAGERCTAPPWTPLGARRSGEPGSGSSGGTRCYDDEGPGSARPAVAEATPRYGDFSPAEDRQAAERPWRGPAGTPGADVAGREATPRYGDTSPAQGVWAAERLRQGPAGAPGAGGVRGEATPRYGGPSPGAGALGAGGPPQRERELSPTQPFEPPAEDGGPGPCAGALGASLPARREAEAAEAVEDTAAAAGAAAVRGAGEVVAPRQLFADAGEAEETNAGGAPAHATAQHGRHVQIQSRKEPENKQTTQGAPVIGRTAAVPAVPAGPITKACLPPSRVKGSAAAKAPSGPRQKLPQAGLKQTCSSLPAPPETGTVYCLGGAARASGKELGQNRSKRLSGLLRRRSLSEPQRDETGDFDEACKALWTGQPPHGASPPSAVPSLKEFLCAKSEEIDPGEDNAESLAVHIEEGGSEPPAELGGEAAAPRESRALGREGPACSSSPVRGPEACWDQPVCTFSALASSGVCGVGTTAPTTELHQQQRRAKRRPLHRPVCVEDAGEPKAEPGSPASPPMPAGTRFAQRGLVSCGSVCTPLAAPVSELVTTPSPDLRLAFGSSPAVTNEAPLPASIASAGEVMRTPMQAAAPGPSMTSRKIMASSPSTPGGDADGLDQDAHSPRSASSRGHALSSPSSPVARVHSCSEGNSFPAPVRRGSANSRPPAALFATSSPMSLPTQGKATGLVVPESPPHSLRSTATVEAAFDLPTPCRASKSSVRSKISISSPRRPDSEHAVGASAIESDLETESPIASEASDGMLGRVEKPRHSHARRSRVAKTQDMPRQLDPQVCSPERSCETPRPEAAAVLPSMPLHVEQERIETGFLQQGQPAACASLGQKLAIAGRSAEADSDSDDPLGLGRQCRKRSIRSGKASNSAATRVVSQGGESFGLCTDRTISDREIASPRVSHEPGPGARKRSLESADTRVCDDGRLSISSSASRLAPTTYASQNQPTAQAATACPDESLETLQPATESDSEPCADDRSDTRNGKMSIASTRASGRSSSRRGADRTCASDHTASDSDALVVTRSQGASKALRARRSSQAPGVPLEECRGAPGLPASSPLRAAPASVGSCAGRTPGAGTARHGQRGGLPDLAPRASVLGIEIQAAAVAIEECRGAAGAPAANPRRASATSSSASARPSTGSTGASSPAASGDEAVLIGDPIVRSGAGDARRAAPGGAAAVGPPGRTGVRHSPGSCWQRPLPASLGGPAALDPIAGAPACSALEEAPAPPRSWADAENNSDAGSPARQAPYGSLQAACAEPAAPASPCEATMPVAGGAHPLAGASETPQGLSGNTGAVVLEASQDASPVPTQRHPSLGSRQEADPGASPPAHLRAEPAGEQDEGELASRPTKRQRWVPSPKSLTPPRGAAAGEETGTRCSKGKRKHADVQGVQGKAPDIEPTPKQKRFSSKALLTKEDDKDTHTLLQRRSPREPEPEEPEREPPRAHSVARRVPKKEVVVKSEPSVPGTDGDFSDTRRACALGGGAPATAGGRLCFATTGLELSSRQKRILLDIGATMIEEWSPEITHLVADTFRRTAKMMCAICNGAHIVTPEYIVACRAAGQSVDEAPYLLKDAVCEAAFARKRGISGGYSLAAALQRARDHGPLLRGISVYCFPSVTEKRELPWLVAAAGGTWLSRFPAGADDSSVLLLAERTVSGEKEQRQRKAHEVYDVELLREAACTQQLRLAAYRLR